MLPRQRSSSDVTGLAYWDVTQAIWVQLFGRWVIMAVKAVKNCFTAVWAVWNWCVLQAVLCLLIVKAEGLGSPYSTSWQRSAAVAAI